MANVPPEAFVVKQEALDEDNLVSPSHFPSSTFIDLRDFFVEDVSLLVSSNGNVSSSFPAPVLDVYLLEDMPSNLNQVQGWSFKTVKDYLKTMFVAPHLSNKLRSLDYQSPICLLPTHHIQQ